MAKKYVDIFNPEYQDLYPKSSAGSGDGSILGQHDVWTGSGDPNSKGVTARLQEKVVSEEFFPKQLDINSDVGKQVSDYIAEVKKQDKSKDEVVECMCEFIDEAENKTYNWRTQYKIFVQEVLRRLELKVDTEHEKKLRHLNDVRPNETQVADKPSKAASRHRPSSTFVQFIIDSTRCEEVLARLHELIDGKPPKNCALTIFAAQQKGMLTQPSYKALSEEFPEIGDRKNYTYYLSRKNNYEIDINSIEKSI